MALSGLGVWIWQWNRCENGDIDAIINKALQCGISWVAVKAGDSTTNGQVTKARVDALRAAGIECAAWWYSVPGKTDAQLAQVADLVHNQGVKHLICDAELEWEMHGNWKPKAIEFAKALRALVGPDVFLADAPWPVRSAHPGFPFDEFGAVMNARMPQLYWGLANQPCARFADRMDHEWHENVCPIGSTVDYNGTRHSPIDDLSEFLDRYPQSSIWSWQHLNAEEWALLKARATTSETISGPVDNSGPAA